MTGVRLALLGTLVLAGCGGEVADEPGSPQAGSPPTGDPMAALLDPDSSVWAEAAPERFTARFQTTVGSFDVAVVREWAPIGVDRFYNLARHGFYDDSRFFRVVEAFIAQFGIPGDPAVTAAWEGRAIRDDPVVASNRRGSLAYAMTGPDTRHTQIYFNLVDNIRLDSTGFAPIGEVVQGLDVMDQLYAGYGEGAGGGMRRGDQMRMLTEGNAHLDQDYPLLDHIVRIDVLPAN